MKRPPERLSAQDIGPPALVLVAWLAVTALGMSWIGRERGFVFALAAASALGLTLGVVIRSRARFARYQRRLDEYASTLGVDRAGEITVADASEFPTLCRSLRSISRELKTRRPTASNPPRDAVKDDVAMTRSGLFDHPSGLFPCVTNPEVSGEFESGDMVNRLDPRLFRWLESSPAEQLFLGWDLRRLREMSFFEIVHPDDLARARDQLRAALVKGEAHGLILRIRTAGGKPRAIEMNVGARYGADGSVSHIRCHLTDVTQKLRSERELRLRTRELTQVNGQLRLINRELEELKERYRDLYQNAPAMYFSLDDQSRIVDCNDTLLSTLGYRREEIVGQPYERLMPESKRPHFAERFAEFLRVGRVEVEGQWVKAGGEVIDVWVTASVFRDGEGRVVQSRSVAQDVTARHRLEAELSEKNRKLARTNDEISRKNREMDEFTYVVSHDLQEPIRTLNAFSDFLLSDYGDRLDDEGREFVLHIVDASRRMRSLIQDLLTLSRAGEVTAEFGVVSLDDVLGVVRRDLAELIRTKAAVIRSTGPLPTVWGDRDRIGQLLANLITNGLKYNVRPDPVVEVGSPDGDGEGGGDVTLFVRDNGIGIEPKFHAKIFQLFRRLHPRDEYEGTGAGLAICSKIVQAHGGKIWVESTAGQGATFFVTLRRPTAAGSGRASQVRPVLEYEEAHES